MTRSVLLAVATLLVAAAPVGAAEVLITTPGKQFSPGRATAVAGDVVVWRNVDAFDAHDIRATDGAFASGTLTRLQAYSRPVATPGTVAFLCSLHPGMSGAVDVVPALLEAPAGEAVAGERVTLTGRAPAGEVVIERQDGATWVEAARTRTAADGAFSASVAPAATTAYRAVGGAGAGPAVRVGVAAGLRVKIRRTASGVAATVAPAPAGARAVLQLYSRERFMWRAAGSRALPRSGKVAFAVRQGLRRRARIVVRRGDGTEVARSGELALWKRGPATRPRTGAPRDEHAGHGDPHAHHAALAAAEPHVTDLPEALAAQIRRAKAARTVPILLPDTIRTEHERLHPNGGADRRSYDFSLAAVPGCGGATACFVASFGAVRGGRPSGRRVALRGGRRGWFMPLRCGASCAPAQIMWKRGDVLYTIAAKIGTARTERARLVALANSAIAAGPR